MNLINSMRQLIDINKISNIYDYLFGIAVLIIFWSFKTVFASILIKIYYMILKSKKQPKESKMFKPLKRFFELLGLFIMFEVFPLNEQYDYIVLKVFKLIGIYYLIKGFTYIINIDNVIIKKFFKDPTNRTVNMFICKIVRTVCWIIYIFIIISECGYNLSYLVTALGVRICSYRTCSTRFCKKFN